MAFTKMLQSHKNIWIPEKYIGYITRTDNKICYVMKKTLLNIGQASGGMEILFCPIHCSLHTDSLLQKNFQHEKLNKQIFVLIGCNIQWPGLDYLNLKIQF